MEKAKYKKGDILVKIEPWKDGNGATTETIQILKVYKKPNFYQYNSVNLNYNLKNKTCDYLLERHGFFKVIIWTSKRTDFDLIDEADLGCFLKKYYYKRTQKKLKAFSKKVNENIGSLRI